MSRASRRKFVVDKKLREVGASTAGKQDTLISGSNIKTINGNSVLGAGNLVITATGGYAEGTTFPGSPTTGTKFYRTDLNWLCFYDGTRWLTCHEYSQPIAVQDSLLPAPSNGYVLGYLPIRQDYFPYVTTIAGLSLVLTTNNGSNYWQGRFSTLNSAGTLTTLTSFSTVSDAAGTRYSKSMTVNQAMTSSTLIIQLDGQKTGSPGTFYPMFSVVYRLIVT